MNRHMALTHPRNNQRDGATEQFRFAPCVKTCPRGQWMTEMSMEPSRRTSETVTNTKNLRIELNTFAKQLRCLVRGLGICGCYKLWGEQQKEDVDTETSPLATNDSENAHSSM